MFGGRLALQLGRDARLDVVVAGRDAGKARAFCAEHGGRWLAGDVASPRLIEIMTAVAPFIVIDAAGPYQNYSDDPYRIARGAIACGAHYLDLSDDAKFTCGITALDEQARAKGVAVLSGASSVPALSSAAVEALMPGIKDLHLIESAILPGNRTPRGVSLLRAIVGQVGRPLDLWRGCVWTGATIWGGLERIDLTVPGTKPMVGRWASFISVPDLALFPARYGARSVLFRAGLELKLMHGGLFVLSGLVRMGLLRSLSPLAPLLKWVADWFEQFGSDRGGMRVRVAGLTDQGETVQRDWTLIAEAGDGPFIPTVPAIVLSTKLLAGEIAPGARPCLAEFTLAEAEAAMSNLKVATHRQAAAMSTLFPHALGNDYAKLPAQLRDLHTVIESRIWNGEAEVTRGTGWLSRLIGRLIGFPSDGTNVPVRVTMRRDGASEIWVREFAGRRFVSRLSAGGPKGSGRVFERFGPVCVEMKHTIVNGRLLYPVRRGTILGLPLPDVLLPRSGQAHECVDELGRARFDVPISLPLAGPIVRYRGWLVPAEAGP